MPEKIRVMIVDDVAETREQLRKLISFDPDIEVVAMVGSGEEAVTIAPKALPDVVLMDINLPGMDGITATGEIVDIMPTVQVVMLSVQGESDYMRRAMMAGARDFLTKPPSADDLLNTIHRTYKLRQKMGTGQLTPGGAPGGQAPVEQRPAQQGKILTVFSPKGGTGCTTIAVNLAIALQTLLGADARICLIDANLQFGDVSIFLKLQATRTLTDLAPHAQDLDSNLLRTVIATHSSGIRVLAAPVTPEEAEMFQDAGVEEGGSNRAMKAILEFAQKEFDYLIIDTARHIDDIVLAALDINDLLLVLTRPIIPDIRGARMFIELLQKLEYPMEHVDLVINNVDNKRMGIQPEAIERAMMPAIAHIPLDERTALRAANYGEPFILKDNRTPIAQAVIDLAKKLHNRFAQRAEEKAAAEEETQRNVGLGRLL
ncbi:MAG: response regulator [Chloroflexi bacterium]|jgi:pilus assembly protein CpaE|nr:response regulator [Chloroflexota bacterium]